MYKLIEFIRSIYVVLLFVIIEAVAINYYAHSSCYVQAKLLTRSNLVVGEIHDFFSGIRHYFSLGRENKVLLERVAALETSLTRYKCADTTLLQPFTPDSTLLRYQFMTARVISNSINKSKNLLILNKGLRDGVRDSMAVLSPGGVMVGYVVDCSAHYAVALSILNTSFRASGKLADSESFGSIAWDGSDQYHVTLGDISKYANLKAGTKVVSTGFSQYFPAGISIGEVVSGELNQTKTSYSVKVHLAVNISQLSDVILVKNNDLQEVHTLETSEKVIKANTKK
ncbi:MAG: rod shape-determining protein MreC [Alistipes sp.]